MKTLLFKQLFLLVAISFVASSFLFAQDKVLHGKVTIYDSIPLIGVSVQVKSTKQIVKTDSVGMFTAFCQQKDKLSISAKGFSRQNVKIQEDAKYIFVNLKLKPGTQNREIAIGYGYVKDKEKLYAISSLNRNQMDFSKYTNIYDVMRGRFPGVDVRNDKIIVRGTSTLYGSDAALLVVDGVIVSQDAFASLSPADIATINILKDASASAYGSRGANGVVLVETKSE